MDLAQAHADLQRQDIRAKCYEDWIRESIFKGMEVIIGIISNHDSARDLLTSRAQICWLFYKVEEIFGIVETVDVDRVKVLSNQDVTCSSEIAHIEGQFNNLSSEASKRKVKEQEILREEERIRKKRKDLTIQQEQVEILSRFEEKGSETGESRLGRSWILQATGFAEGENPSEEFYWLCNLL
ncbi:hypothetical protein Cgig2_008339 [Carnegiea gigantea]|uniref:Uncharacterized protein n=1 Tax=Carnegiea gigantea TaxID=171969 RepID=A0A9Q1QD01_9CARY|nr:hypothetical protein Cgig2_008339 [Carnegiea gigantea]